tara:strand:+ start:107786 stop:108769 length:984 start_codon:yes stop_codon:yes gene_type:complete
MKFLKLLIGHSISFAFIYLLLDKLDLDKLQNSNHSIHWEYFSLAILINIISYFIHGLRWNRFYMDQKIDFSHIIKTILIGHMFNTILPSKAGELMRPLFFHRITKIPYLDILSTCFIERVFDGLIVLFLLLFSINIFGTNTFITNASLLTLCLYFSSLVFIIIALRFNKIISLKLANRSSKIIQTLSNLFTDFISGAKRIKDIKNLNIIVFYSLLYWILNILALWSILHTLDLPLELQSISVAIFIAGSMGVALSLPSAPANIGVYHYAIYFIFTFIVERKQDILVDSNLFIMAAVLIHLGAIIPDLILGGVSYYTYPNTKKDSLLN